MFRLPQLAALVFGYLAGFLVLSLRPTVSAVPEAPRAVPPPCPPITNATCDCPRAAAPGRGPSQRARGGAAVRCADSLLPERMGIPMRCPVLGRCAADWIMAHKETELRPGEPKVLFDYAYDGLDSPLLRLPRDWLLALAFLRQDTMVVPDRRGLPPNVLLMATPILYRMRALFATPTLFDVQLILRLDDVVTYATPFDIWNLLGRMLGMGRVSYVMLPCVGLSEVDEIAAVRRAIATVVAQRREIGIRTLEVDVTAVAAFEYKGCTRQLLRVTVQRLHRVVRAKWCYYPAGGAFDLHYEAGGPVRLVAHRGNATADGVAKVIERRRSGITVADAIAWGLTRPQRELLFYRMLQFPNSPMAQPHNWLITWGGEVERLESVRLEEPFPDPRGEAYVDFLRLSTCTWGTREVGIKWRLVHLARGGGQSQPCYLSEDLQFYFCGDRTVSTRGGQPANVVVEAADCPDCRTCIAADHLKQIVPAAQDGAPRPTPACASCLSCRVKQVHSRGLSMIDVFYGCIDVEGVNENSTPDWSLCDDSQTARPALPSRARPITL